jgi:hypothetical protein
MAATLVLRTVKGTPLTNLEVDNNFSNLNTFGDVVSSNVGVLSALTTTSTSNIVFAVNSIKSGNLSQFGATTSAQLASIISDETGTGNLVFATSPILTTPDLGTPSAVVLTNATGTVTNLTLVTPNVGTPSYINLTNATGTASSLTANIANFINVTDDTTSNVTVYPIFANNTSGAITEQVSSTKLTFNPSTGLLTSTDYNSSSDMTLKQDITYIQNPLDIISQLTGFGFTWKDSKQKAYGLSAQEVEKVIPEIVKDRPDGTKGINYMNLTAFLIEAIKDLKQEVTELKKHK